MGQILNLPNDILGTIMIMLVTSCNGATDLARLSATCSLFWSLAGEHFILKVVNFQSISMDDYEAHHNMKGLLCLCARAGNLAAESMLGKALMHNDRWFWNMILEHDTPLLAQNPSANGLLQHPKLVRSFIRNASGEVVSTMRIPFFSYMISFLGHSLARSSGILDAVTNLCLYELSRDKRDDEIDAQKYVTLNGLNPAIFGLPPLSGPSYRERLLAKFDEMFPLNSECAMLLNRALDSRVLKVVNFQYLTNTNDFTKQHHENDFFCTCDESGNRAAQSILGKALLVDNTWFWRNIFVDFQQAFCGCLKQRLVLFHHRLVRTFILHATSQDIAATREHLIYYVIKYAGYNVASECGIIYAIFSMCSYEATKRRVSKNGPENVRNRVITLTFGSFESIVVRLEPPREALYRDTVIDLFDKLFPSSHA